MASGGQEESTLLATLEYLNMFLKFAILRFKHNLSMQRYANIILKHGENLSLFYKT